MESWIIEVGIVLAGSIGTYAVARNRLERLEVDFKDHVKKDDEVHEKENTESSRQHDKATTKLDAGFKKLDSVIDRVIVLEQTTKEHLGLREAEDKFVSHKELQLHLKNIENSMMHIEKNSDSMTKKLEELTSILSNNIVKTLSAGDR
jgi:hypothetical protein